MKVIAILLLLLNLAYVGWMQLVGRTPLSSSETSEPVPSSESRFVAAGQQLMLVSERPAALPAVETISPEDGIAVEGAVVEQPVSPGGAIAAAPDVPASPVPWCGVATGFEDASSAEGFVAAVNGAGGAAELQSEEVRVSSNWWVHLPAFTTEAAAAEALAELQAKQIDSFQIKSGELAGAISLGVFSRSERAVVAQQELQAKGYPASVREIVRFASQFSVPITLGNARLREATEWADLNAKFPAAELHEIACK